MSKLPRDVRAWAKRVQMSRQGIFALVEGDNGDIPYYEFLLRDGAGVQDVRVLRARDLTIGGVSAGGKAHLVKVLHELDQLDFFGTTLDRRRAQVVFFMDKDDDDFLGRIIDHPNVAYTQNADVEADITFAADICRVFSVGCSVSTDVAREVVGDDLGQKLSESLADWIVLRLAAAECGWHGPRFSQCSTIHVDSFGALIEDELESVCRSAETANPIKWHRAHQAASQYVTEAIRTGEGAKLIKGKWIVRYVNYLADRHLTDSGRRPKIGEDAWRGIGLANVDYSSAWIHRYQHRLGALVSGAA